MEPNRPSTTKQAEARKKAYIAAVKNTEAQERTYTRRALFKGWVQTVGILALFGLYYYWYDGPLREETVEWVKEQINKNNEATQRHEVFMQQAALFLATESGLLAVAVFLSLIFVAGASLLVGIYQESMKKVVMWKFVAYPVFVIMFCLTSFGLCEGGGNVAMAIYWTLDVIVILGIWIVSTYRHEVLIPRFRRARAEKAK